MSLGSALQIGRSGLAASQTALEVTGQNLANVATRGYHRQTVALQPVGDGKIGQGLFVGRGVMVEQIVRQINAGLETRVRSSIADQASTLVRRDSLAQIEAIQGELTDQSLTGQLYAFFNSWSELANNPLDHSVQTLVIQQGRTLSDFIKNQREELTRLRTQVDEQIDATARAVNDLLQQIEELNGRIATTEGGAGGAHSLRDQRDIALNELAQYMDISLNERSGGAIDVFVGSLPIVLNGKSRGLELDRRTVEGELVTELRIKEDGSVLAPTSGELGALIRTREQDIGEAVAALDEFANELAFEVNRLHTRGQGLRGFQDVTGTQRVLDADAALNSADADIPFTIGHGSFDVTVTQKSTGQQVTHTIDVDLDGIDAANDTSLTALIAQIDALNNVAASVTTEGKLRIASTDSDYELTFNRDTSGALAALGINTFFQGGNARDIAVNPLLEQTTTLLASGRNHIEGDNSNAMAIAQLRERPLDSLGGLSLIQKWNRHIETFAVRAGQMEEQVAADAVVRESLEAQQQSVSGVNPDEEAINLMSYQRAYQGSARFLSVVDELMQTLLSLV